MHISDGNQGNTSTLHIPVIYSLVEGDKVTQSEKCFAISFNKESNIMVAGCDKQIKVFEFQLGQLKQIQLLSEHTGNVTVLYYMKKSNEFISGGGTGDKSIRIWGVNDSSQYYCEQLLKNGHSGPVYGVIMNRNEDLIISCSSDERIKLWTKENEWQCFQTLTDHQNRVMSVSLNESQNQFVSCGDDQQIMIYQLGVNKVWERIQNIDVNTQGVRLCFIGDIIITYQPLLKETMLIFELNQQTKQFIKVKEVKVDTFPYFYCFFPQVFNKPKQILLNKNGETVYLMNKQNDSDFIIEQALKFGTEHVYGTMTDEGEYLVTWDDNTSQYQVRKQTE